MAIGDMDQEVRVEKKIIRSGGTTLARPNYIY